MLDIAIRAECAESAADAAAIEALTLAAFQNVPHSAHNEHRIVAALRRDGALAVSLLAAADGVIVGHVALSPVTLSDGSGGWFGLGPISVLPEYQRCQVGSRLMHAALAALRQMSAQGCVVLGDPGFYGRFGFRAIPELVLPGVPSEYFQALYLGAARPQGRVAYHAAFNA